MLVKPLPCLQGTSLECSFGLEESFEAVWVNDTLVRCNQVVVSGMTPGGHRGDPLGLLPSSPYVLLLSGPHPRPRPPPTPPSSALIHLGGTLAPTGDPHPTLLTFLILQLHTTQKSQVFPLSLKLKGPPDRFLDSPNPMTGECPTYPPSPLGGAQPSAATNIVPHKCPHTR